MPGPMIVQLLALCQNAEGFIQRIRCRITFLLSLMSAIKRSTSALMSCSLPRGLHHLVTMVLRVLDVLAGERIV